MVGIPQGSYRTNTDIFSIPSPVVGASGQQDISATAPVNLCRPQKAILQAEAAVRGWLTTDAPAQELFEQGIRASFESYDVPNVETYLATSPAAQWPAGMEAQIRAIIFRNGWP